MNRIAQYTGDAAQNTAQYTGDAGQNTAQYTGDAAQYTAQYTGDAAQYTAQYTGLYNVSHSTQKVPSGPPLPCGCNLVFCSPNPTAQIPPWCND